MRYRTPEAFRAALDQRLKNEVAASGASLMRLRKRVAFERFLARLAATGRRGWVLKGAFALDLRLDSELVDPERLRKLFARIEGQLYRFPAIDPAGLSAKLAKTLGL